MESQNTPNQLNRRKWLRDTALAATSVVVVPSMLIGCSDHRIPPMVGVGSGMEDVPLTPAELAKAAQNLSHMEAFMKEVHGLNLEYKGIVYEWLTSSKQIAPSGFSQFLLSLITAIVIGIMGIVVAAAVAAEVIIGPAGTLIAATVGAAISIVSLNIKTWALPDGSSGNPTLAAAFADFDKSQLDMRTAMSDLLDTMSDAKDNYKNLREGWKDAIDFNGKKYTLRDLANSTFPNLDEGSDTKTVYVNLRNAATEHFKKQIWNVMIAKAGSMSRSNYWGVDVVDPNKTYYRTKPTEYGREVFYKNPENQSRYLRGWFSHWSQSYFFCVWMLSFDGRELSAAAAKELFKDDTPGHIINPTGFFNRDYVFKQFHQEKPDFRVWDITDGSQQYYDLRKDLDWGPNDGYSRAMGFADLPDDFEFIGGEFPQLKKK